MLALTLYTYLSMRGMEHNVEPMRGTRTLSALCLLVCLGAATKLYWVRGYKLYRPPNVIVFYVLYLLWVIFPTLLYGVDGDLSDFITVFMGEVMPLCTVLITYNYMMNHGEKRRMRWFFCFMAVVYAYGFVSILFDLQSLGSVIQMIVSYFTLYILPLIMLTSGKKMRVLFIILTILVLTISLKRGGLAALACGLAAYGITYFFSAKKIKTSAIVSSIFLLALFAGLFIFLGTSEESNVVERFENMENDEGSGRTSVWRATCRLLAHSDAVPLVAGHGYSKVMEDSPLGLSAHNDFLEICYDYGIVGLVLYLCAGICLLNLVIRLILRKRDEAPAAAMFFTVYFILSMISHIIIYPWGNVILLTVAYICAKEDLYARNE